MANTHENTSRQQPTEIPEAQLDQVAAAGEGNDLLIGSDGADVLRVSTRVDGGPHAGVFYAVAAGNDNAD